MDSLPPAPKYIPVVNSLRGLAALGVCISHFISQPLHFFDHNSLTFQYNWLGTLGVQIFFVITGIVIPISLLNGKYTYSSFGKFILKRFARIEPPYIFSIIAGVIFILLKNSFLTKAPDPIPSAYNLLLHLGYLIPFFKGQNWFIGPYWTLAIEFQFYLLISLIFPLIITNNFRTRFITYCLIFIGSIAYKNDSFVLVWLPIFLMGIIYVSFRYKKIGVFEFWFVFIITSLLCFYLHTIPMTVAALLTLFMVHFFSNYQSKIGNFFGDISYSLYLIHMFLGVAVVNYLVPKVSKFPAMLGVVLIGLIVSIISAYIFYLLIEKPSKKLASKIGFKSKLSTLKEEVENLP